MAIPIHYFVSLFCLLLAVKVWKSGARSALFLSLLTLCAVQSSLVALRTSLALDGLRWVQPVTATLIPILAYFSFLTLSQQGNFSYSVAKTKTLLLHSIPVALVLISQFLAPKWIDTLLFNSYVFYGVLILWKTRSGADALIIVRLESAGYTLRVWRVIGVMLLLLATVDLIISLDGGIQSGRLSIILATVSSALMILVLAIALSISSNVGPISSVKANVRHKEKRTQTLETTSHTLIEAAHASTAEQTNKIPNINSPGPLESVKGVTAEHDLMPQIEETILRQQLYKDPNLNLAKLARKLGIPSRKVSQQINQSTGLNVSQYINKFRIKETCNLLENTEQRVTDIMLAVGFFTKSNFNREFLRATKMSPSEWRTSQENIKNAKTCEQDL